MDKNIMKTTKEINDTLATNGWLIIINYFNDELKRLNDLNNIDDTLPLDKQAVQVKANKEAYKIISSILEGVKGLARIEAKKKIKYE